MPEPRGESTETVFLLLKGFVESLPLGKTKRRSIFEIAGYPSWENVVSNMLSFYFSEDEQHNFNRTIFDALLRLLKERFSVDIETFQQSPYTVLREKSFIDILITSDSGDDAENNWAILIENKVKASLYNNLAAYWDSVNASTKIGIVLSLYPISETDIKKRISNGCTFYNIVQKDLCTSIKNSLPELYNISDDRHLLYLKDFIQNIEAHYKDHSMDKELTDTLERYYNHSEVIDKLKEMEIRLNNFVGISVWDGIAPFAFYPTGSLNVQTKHYYYDYKDAIESQEEAPNHPLCNAFRFWVYQLELFRYGLLTINFELYDDYSRYGAKLKQLVQERDLIKNGPLLKELTGGGEQYSYFHIAGISKLNIKPEITQNGLQKTITDIMRGNFFQSPTGFVFTCAELLSTLINSNDNTETSGIN